MPSFAKCLYDKKFSKLERNKLQSAAKMLIDEGFTTEEAQRMAVKSAITELESERQETMDQVKKITDQRNRLEKEMWAKPQISPGDKLIYVDPQKLMADYLKQDDEFAQQIREEIAQAKGEMSTRTARVGERARDGNKYQPAQIFSEVQPGRLDFSDGRHRMLFASQMAMKSVPVITSPKSMPAMKKYLTRPEEKIEPSRKSMPKKELQAKRKELLNGRDLFDVMNEVQPDSDLVVSLRQLRDKTQQVNPSISKNFFDEWVRDLAKEGRIKLLKHDFPGLLSKEEKEQFVDIDGNLFTSALRMDTPRYSARTLSQTLQDAEGSITRLQNYLRVNPNWREVGNELGVKLHNNQSLRPSIERIAQRLKDRIAIAERDRQMEKYADTLAAYATMKQALDFDDAIRSGFRGLNPAKRDARSYLGGALKIGEGHVGPALIGTRFRPFGFTPTSAGITLNDVKQIFKGQEVGINPDGSIWVQTRSGQGLQIKNVNVIDVDRAAFDLAYGEMNNKGELVIAGKYNEGIIEIRKDVGDTFTLAHESYHWLEDVGYVTENEADTLRRHILDLHAKGKFDPVNSRDIGGAEDRANFVAWNLSRRQNVESNPIRYLLNKIGAFVDRLVNLFTRTAGGIVRDIESGRIFERPATVTALETGAQLARSRLRPRFVTPAGKPYEIGQSIVQRYLRQLFTAPRIDPDEITRAIESEVNRLEQLQEATANTLLKRAIPGRLKALRKFVEDYRAGNVQVERQAIPGYEITPSQEVDYAQALDSMMELAAPVTERKLYPRTVQQWLRDYIGDTDVELINQELQKLLDDKELLHDQLTSMELPEALENMLVERDIVDERFDQFIDKNIVPLAQDYIKRALAVTRPMLRRIRKQFGIRYDSGFRPEKPPLDIRLKNAILKTAQKIAKGKANMRVRLADIYEAMSIEDLSLGMGNPLENFHNALFEMQQSGKLVLMHLDDPQERFERDEQVALDILGNKRHIAYFEDYVPLAVPQVTPDNFDRPVPQYMAMSPQDEEFIEAEPDKAEARRLTRQLSNDSMGAWNWLKDIWRERNKDWEGTRADTSMLDRLLSTPLHYFSKVPALKALFDIGQGRQDRKFNIINQLQQDADGNSMLAEFESFRKNNKAGYKRVKNYLIQRDRDQEGYRISSKLTKDRGRVWYVYDPKRSKKDKTIPNMEFVDTVEETGESKAVKAMIQLESQDLLDKGWSEDMVRAVAQFRTITNNGFNVLIRNLRNMAERYKAAGKKVPPVAIFDGADRVKVDINVALAKMGDLRGYYFPRIRQPGRYTLYAQKQGTNPILKHYDLKSTMNMEANKLRKRGYTIKKKDAAVLPEDVFEVAGSVIGLQTHISHAFDRARSRLRNATARGIDVKIAKRQAYGGLRKELAELMPNIELEFIKAVAEQVANNIKARGARAHMIGRNDATGKDVWVGYEEDPVIALGSYVRGMAGGEAKREMAFQMLRAFTGMDETWRDFKARMSAAGQEVTYEDYLEMVDAKRINPRAQRNAFRDGKNYMQDMLRNDERIDRFTGMVKSIAVLKYLAGRVSSPLINLTAMITSYPAAANGIAGISINKAIRSAGSSIVDYERYWFGDKDKLDFWTRQALDDIHRNGWHESQYNREALAVLKSKIGRGYDRFMEVLMCGFGTTERINRVSSILGTYKALRDKAKGEWNTDQHEAALVLAKEVSDKSHGVYNKANRPDWARGGNPAARIAQAFYIFKTFSHNYLLTMKQLGFRNPKATAYMVLSPAIIAGAGASVATPIIAAMMKAFDIGGDDPEEGMYQWLEANLGETAGELARSGLFGAGGYGVNLKGSLALNVTDLPTDLISLAGAPGSILMDFWYAGRFIQRGNPYKGIERILPAFMGNVMKAYREHTEGLTTSSNAPIFYGKEPVELDLMEAFLRAISFNPARIATIREKQWKEKKLEQKYAKRKSDIYAKIIAFYSRERSDRDREDWQDLLNEVREFNTNVKELGFYISPITGKSIKNAIRRAYRPSKKERLRK